MAAPLTFSQFIAIPKTFVVMTIGLCGAPASGQHAYSAALGVFCGSLNLKRWTKKMFTITPGGTLSCRVSPTLIKYN